MRNLGNIVRESAESELIQARKAVNTNPTPAQIEIGNYAKGHVKILGFNITIENPKGSYRKGKDRNGKEWKTLMHNDYGYFVRTLGKDGDAIDVFIGPNLKSEKIYPIDQFINGEFDETKVMLGFDSKEEAKKAYLSNYEKDWKGFKYITEVDIDTFKKWLYDGYRQRKPFAKYVTLTESKTVKNDKGEIVPEKCDKCGGDVVVQIHGEPVYLCKKCGKYFGTMPCNLKEHIDIKKALKSLKKRRDPANIENWDSIINEELSSTENDVFDKVFVHYGSEHNDMSAQNAEALELINKPVSGLWGAELNDDMGSDWGDWCRGEHFRLKSLSSCFLFKLKPGIKVLTINGKSDIYPFTEMSKRSFGMDFYRVNVQKILDNFDALYVTENGRIELDDDAIFCIQRGRYDVASVCVFNPQNVIEIDETDIERGGHKDYSQTMPVDDYISDGGQEDLIDLQSQKMWQMYGNRNILNKDRAFGNELPGMVAQGNGKNAEMAKKYNGTIHSALNEKTNMINEDFSSRLLAKYAKEHGGLSVRRNGGLRDGVRAYHGGSKIDPAKVTDDMLQGEPYKYDWQNSTEAEYNNSIHFADGYAVMLKPYDHKRDDNINVPSQRKKPSRYYTGVGDTGDHDKSRGGFVGNGKDNVSAPYNGFSVSDRAGEAKHYREAMKNNRDDINYIQNHKEYYKDWPEKIRNANKNIDTIKGYTKELLNKPKTISESQLRQIIRESIEEFYKGSQNEKAAYENACDCLYYGYGFKFWFERNSHLLNNDSVIAKDIWRQAIDDMANR